MRLQYLHCISGAKPGKYPLVLCEHRATRSAASPPAHQKLFSGLGAQIIPSSAKKDGFLSAWHFLLWDMNSSHASPFCFSIVPFVLIFFSFLRVWVGQVSLFWFCHFLHILPFLHDDGNMWLGETVQLKDFPKVLGVSYSAAFNLDPCGLYPARINQNWHVYLHGTNSCWILDILQEKDAGVWGAGGGQEEKEGV